MRMHANLLVDEPIPELCGTTLDHAEYHPAKDQPDIYDRTEHFVQYTRYFFLGLMVEVAMMIQVSFSVLF